MPPLAAPSLWRSGPADRAEERAERSEGVLGATKEVLFIDFLDFSLDFLGFPYSSIRISIRFLSGF